MHIINRYIAFLTLLMFTKSMMSVEVKSHKCQVTSRAFIVHSQLFKEFDNKTNYLGKNINNIIKNKPREAFVSINGIVTGEDCLPISNAKIYFWINELDSEEFIGATAYSNNKGLFSMLVAKSTLENIKDNGLYLIVSHIDFLELQTRAFFSRADVDKSINNKKSHFRWISSNLELVPLIKKGSKETTYTILLSLEGQNKYRKF